jgi:HSP20 family protein
MTPMMRRNAAWLPSVFNDLFDTDFGHGMYTDVPRRGCTAPAINVKETDKAYIVELAAPGMKKEDFNVHINDEGNLIVKMEQKEEKKDEDKNTRYLRREFSYTKFEQTLILPEDVEKDQIKARVEHGVLTVELPKHEEQKVKVSRQIEIG